MNRKAKRARRMRAQQHQKTIKGKPRLTSYKDGTKLLTEAGPKASPSYHKSDPPKHGQRLDARGQALADLRGAGIQDTSDEIVRSYQELKRLTGSASAAFTYLDAQIKSIKKARGRQSQAKFKAKRS